MLNMDKKLEKREEEGKIIRAGIVGAGQMGRGMVTQMALMKGIMPAIVSDIKFENVINRVTAGANPRQIERVPAGTEFAFTLVYNIERADELMEDMEMLRDGLRLLQMDYLGGHGSRGYGRVSLRGFAAECFALSDDCTNTEQLNAIARMMEEGGGSM